MHRDLAQGRGKALKTHSRAHLPWEITHCCVCTEPAHRERARLCPGGPGTAGGTHGGKGADLFDVLFVALRAGGPPGGASGVPEGVVILQRVLSRPRDHSLHKGKACLPLVCSSKKENGKNYIYRI